MSKTSTLKRTSMSLDAETLENLEKLANIWNTSKSEVVRRSIRKAKEQETATTTQLTPIEALRRLRGGDGISPAQAQFLRDEITAERQAKIHWWE